MRPDLRRWTRIALPVLTAVLLALTAVSGYARSELSDRDGVATRVTSALDDAGVRAVMADRIVDGLTDGVAPELLNLRPLLVPAVAAALDTPPVRRGFERAVRARHRTLVEGDGRYVLEPGPALRVVVRALRSVSPRFAAALPEDPRVRLLVLEPKGFELTTVRVIDGVAGWFWPLAGAVLLAAVACAASAGDVRGAVLALGAAVAGAGLATAAVVTLAGAFVVDRAAHAGGLDDDTERDAVRAVWDALAGDLRSAALVAAVAGAVAAAVAAGPVAAVPLRRVAARAVAVARSPRPVVRTARLLALVLAGLVLLVEPGLAVRAALLGLGAGMVLWGVVGLSARAAPSRADGPSSPALVGGVAVAALAIATLGTLAVLPSPGAGTAGAERAGDACNGRRELCDRRLNEVVFPATHNSYAAADQPGWFFASQRHGIARQLEDGVRAFLIDVHFGRPDPSSGRVRTDLAYEGSSRNKVARALSPEALRAADRLAGRVGAPLPPGERAVYLCHTLCELGAEPLRDQLRLFASFLDEHPRDVVILFVEPYVPPAAIEEAMGDSGLLDQAAELERDQPLPTLGELVEAGTRVVVLAEEDGGARPWYLPGFSFAQDTPLGAQRPDDLRCTRFRGGPDAPLLLLNHWIPPFPPSVRRNEAIGGMVLRERAERCAAQRGQRPNLLAVDFYERTRVVEVSAELNR